MSGRDGPDIAAVYQLLSEVARMVAAQGHKLEDHDRRFDQIDRRFDQIDRQLEEHDCQFGAQGGKINELVRVANEHGQVLGEITARLAQHDAKLDDLAAGLVTLRDALSDYHNTVVGHGISITDLDERVRAIEQTSKTG
jgi:hypothetical protein